MQKKFYLQDALSVMQKTIENGIINEQQFDAWIISMMRKEVEQKHNQSICLNFLKFYHSNSLSLT